MTISINAKAFGPAWQNTLHAILNHGDEVAPRGLRTKELLNLTFTVDDARACLLDCPARKLSYRFATAEWLWIWFGSDKLAPLERFAPSYARFSDDGVTLAGAYGPRLNPQWAYVFDQLREDPDTRKAVMSIWTPNPARSLDTPCTLTFHLMMRRGALHGVVTMRSSDAWLGLPYDFHSFAMLLGVAAFAVAADVGSLTFNLASSHLYEKNWDAAESCLNEGRFETLRYPVVKATPPAFLNSLLHEGARSLSPADVHTLKLWKSVARALLAEREVDAYAALAEMDFDAR